MVTTMSRNAQRMASKAEPAPGYEPRTLLGRRLWELRQEILAEGEPLLEWTDVEREVASRRGHRSIT